ncbi:MAG: hypothetical protein HFI39_02870 [Lachnospiraceae bacterium]|nr:hypothetical protein [Lachnospiraceae bacterium]
MKITSTTWQTEGTLPARQTAAPAPGPSADAKPAQKDSRQPQTDRLLLSSSQPEKSAEEEEESKFLRFLQSLEKSGPQSMLNEASQKADSKNDFKVSSSSKGESVGQLAALLARAETRVDVLQVSSKVTRALLDLKMAAANAKGDEAKKLARQIKRYEKLMKRIDKKLKHLAKEEQLELRRKRAVKQMEFEKEEELRQELKNRRSKRRKDEKNYAAKELEEDRKAADAEMAAAMTGGGAPANDALAFAEGGLDLSAIGGDAVSFDALG